MSKRTIVIADDEYGFRFPCRVYHRSRGFDVGEASNEKAFCERISGAYLLPMDEIFPGGREGIEIVKKIRKSGDKNIKNAPVVFLPILSESVCAGGSLEDAGLCSWLQKPFESETSLTETDKLIPGVGDYA